VADRIDPFEAEIERIVRRAALEADRSMTVLDAGAGESRHAGGFSHCRYIALDRCVGDGRWNYRGVDVCADATQLPMADRSVDRVLCVVTLEHIEDPGAAIAEFARVLRPGGRLYMVTPLMWEEHQAPHDYFRFTTWGLRSLLQRAGLQVLEIEPIGGFFWMCGRRSVNLLSFFQSSWRWIFFPFLLPLAGFAVPVFCYYLDFMDREKKHTLGHRLTAVR
jgi:SAM-dependent methyltransferase